MPGGKGNITPDDNTSGFQKNPQNINRTGENRGLKGLTESLRDSINSDGFMIYEDIIELDESGKETGNKFKRGKIKVTKKEIVIIAALKQAAKGDMRAVEFIFDRIEGKAKQSIELETKTPTKIIFENVSKIDNSLLEDQSPKAED